jgi:hypothetical protein
LVLRIGGRGDVILRVEWQDHQLSDDDQDTGGDCHGSGETGEW